MTLKLRALLSFFAGRQQGNEQVRSCLTVIPAKAGIQSNMRPKDTTFFLLSAAHIVLALDSGFRRNDDDARLGICAYSHSAEMPA
ncbi:hypothetical protein [Dyella nitratireducens]|uniref:hypothetical protein n=1 Tax=Dyella nitratireducens TaxID=1849580 RepID=UPI001669D19C|nr:hypothetical protein [Dyella nitratireducens]